TEVRERTAGGKGTIEKVSGNLAYVRYDKNSLNAQWHPIETLKYAQESRDSYYHCDADGNRLPETNEATTPTPAHLGSYYDCDEHGNRLPEPFRLSI
ncbi:MAG: hypothetical protein WCD18_27375, partial [Thermosynechococcaceae cyanobacterium]